MGKVEEMKRVSACICDICGSCISTTSGDDRAYSSIVPSTEWVVMRNELPYYSDSKVKHVAVKLTAKLQNKKVDGDICYNCQSEILRIVFGRVEQ